MVADEVAAHVEPAPALAAVDEDELVHQVDAADRVLARQRIVDDHELARERVQYYRLSGHEEEKEQETINFAFE